MRPSRRSGKFWGWLAIAVILGLMWPVQMATFLNPVKMHYRTEVLPYFKSHGDVERFGGYIAGESATGAFMAGFRNIARTLLWIKVDELWHGGRWYRMLPVMVAITRVDPHFITVWETFGWHLAWNLNAAAKEGSIQAARDIESAARGLHEAMRQVSPELEKPLADDLADAQREVEIATRDLNEAYLDQQRLNEVLAGLRDALQHLAYAWERAAASIQDTSVLAPITQAQGNLLGSAERLAHQRAEERQELRRHAVEVPEHGEVVDLGLQPVEGGREDAEEVAQVAVVLEAMDLRQQLEQTVFEVAHRHSVT